MALTTRHRVHRQYNRILNIWILIRRRIVYNAWDVYWSLDSSLLLSLSRKYHYLSFNAFLVSSNFFSVKERSNTQGFKSQNNHAHRALSITIVTPRMFSRETAGVRGYSRPFNNGSRQSRGAPEGSRLSTLAHAMSWAPERLSEVWGWPLRYELRVLRLLFCESSIKEQNIPWRFRYITAHFWYPLSWSNTMVLRFYLVLWHVCVEGIS